jgi:hypothetical protein
LPLLEAVPSILRLWITLNQNGREIVLEERGTIEQLSEKFQFTIEGLDSWDFTGFKGRKCNILKDGSGYHFVGYV